VAGDDRPPPPSATQRIRLAAELRGPPMVGLRGRDRNTTRPGHRPSEREEGSRSDVEPGPAHLGLKQARESPFESSDRLQPAATHRRCRRTLRRCEMTAKGETDHRDEESEKQNSPRAHGIPPGWAQVGPFGPDRPNREGRAVRETRWNAPTKARASRGMRRSVTAQSREGDGGETASERRLGVAPPWLDS